ncbi:MAG: hypothetical protein KGS48_10855 [Bacteroidetes bacterium]|nr:hypothetical protein [Bacteroidota bacterium]
MSSDILYNTLIPLVVLTLLFTGTRIFRFFTHQKSACTFDETHMQPVLELFNQKEQGITAGDLRMSIAPARLYKWAWLGANTQTRAILESPGFQQTNTTLCLLSFFYKKQDCFEHILQEGQIQLPEGWRLDKDQRFLGLQWTTIYIPPQTDMRNLFKFVIQVLAEIAHYPENGVFTARTAQTSSD